MSHSNSLKVAHGTNATDNHFFKFFLRPEQALLLPLSEQVFQVQSIVHVFTDHRDPKGVIHRFIKIVSVKLKYIGMILYFEKIDGFFLIFI